MKKSLVAIIMILAGSFGAVSAQKTEVITSDKAGWHKIGETTVDFSRDRDEIKVMGADRFATVQFKVTDAPIELIAMEVYFESGDKQDIKINMAVKAPGESRMIDLNGGERSLKKIVFIYKTLPNMKDAKAHVELWGMKTNSDKK